MVRVRWRRGLMAALGCLIILSCWKGTSHHRRKRPPAGPLGAEGDGQPEKEGAVLPDCPPPSPSTVNARGLLEDGGAEAAGPPSSLQPGGWYKPDHCRARHRVAILVPYRDREEHLAKFLRVMHPFLSQQTIEYTIFVVEQAGNNPFNRAKLLNIGYTEASRLGHFDCFYFHDVDLIPENGGNIYDCPQDNPRHMSVAVSTMGYKLQFKDLVGGVSVMTKHQMESVNGFSNKYWGWGSEDNDMYNRLKYRGYKVQRRQPDVGRYIMLSHTKEESNPTRYDLVTKWRKRLQTDGLSSLKYSLLSLEFRPLYTWILADLFWEKESLPSPDK